jgi:trehalose synthase
VLLDDPADLDTFGKLVLALLEDPQRAHDIGVRAREHVRRHFLANRHAVQYIELFASIIEARASRSA